MTITVLPTRNEYTSASPQTVFNYTFKIFNNTELNVYITPAGQACSASDLTTAYTVTQVGDASGGTIILNSATTAGDLVTIVSNIPGSRTTDYQTNGDFLPTTVNNDFDQTLSIAKQTETSQARTPQFPECEQGVTDFSLPTPTAGSYLRTKTDLSGYENAGVPAVIISDTNIGVVADMQAATGLTIGQIVTTTGYVSAGDAGDNEYEIVATATGTDDGGSFIDLAGSGHQAKGLFPRGLHTLEQFGGANGTGNNTSAMDAIETYLGTIGGGIIDLAFAKEYKMNWVCATENIKVRMPGGKGEFDTNCIRPFALTSAGMTFGNGTTDFRNIGIINVNISGTDGLTGSDTNVAQSAPHCLLLRGGCIGFKFIGDCTLYNGIRTLSMEPTATNPVTATRFPVGHIRNDLTDSANARAIYSNRLADPGYNTDNIISAKVNGPTLGYAAEIDGTVTGMTFNVANAYWDVKPGKGVYMNGNVTIECDQWYLDPGTTGAVIIETTDTNPNPARTIHGNLIHGGQVFDYNGGTTTIPAEANFNTFKQMLYTPSVFNQLFFVEATDIYNTTVSFDVGGGGSGPITLVGADYHVQENIHVYGGNATAAGIITAVGVSGGLYLSAVGTNQNVQLVPSGTGFSVLAGQGTHPSANGSQQLGNAGFRWSEVFATNGTINTSDAREKQQGRDLTESEQKVSVKLRKLIKAFRWNDAVEKKSRDKARWHFGAYAQEVAGAFKSEGLDAAEYGMFCYDEWEDQYEDESEEKIIPKLDEKGKEVFIEGTKTPLMRKVRVPTGKKKLVKEAGNSYGLRYEEMLAFIIAAM